VPHHFERVGSQITGCSNLYPLNASQSVSKIRLQLFTVSCFTVNKKAQKDSHKKTTLRLSSTASLPPTARSRCLQRCQSALRPTTWAVQ
jgi:hypothetical protein